MRLSAKYLPIVGLILFGYIISRVGYERVLEIFFSLNLFFLAPLFIVVALNVLLKAYKWKLIIKAHKVEFSIKSSCKLFLIGMFAGLITPGRAGDIIRAFYMREKGITLGRSISTVFIDRLLDILSLVFLFLIAAVWLSIILGSATLPFAFTISLLGVVIVSIYLVFQRTLIKRTLRPVYVHFSPQRYKAPLREGFENFYDSLTTVNKRSMIAPFIYGFLSWLLTALEGYFIAKALGLSIPYLYLAAFIPIITIAELLPISISGIGTRDAAVISLFTLIGLSPDLAVAFSILYLVLGYWTAAFIGGVLWITSPLQVRLLIKEE